MMFIALTVGILGGGLLGLAASLRIVRLLAVSPRETVVHWAGAIGTVAIAIPSFFLAMVVGGNLGGGAGAAVAARFGFEALGASIGIAIGLGATLAVGLVLGAFSGALIGRIIVGAWRGV